MNTRESFDGECASNSCKIHFGTTHNTLSFMWDNASGCIDMMPFLLRSLHRGDKYGSDTPLM